MPLSLPPNPYGQGQSSGFGGPGGYGSMGQGNYGGYQSGGMGIMPAPSFSWMKGKMGGPKKIMPKPQPMTDHMASSEALRAGNNAYNRLMSEWRAQQQQSRGPTMFDQAFGAMFGPGGDFAQQEAASRYQFEAGRDLLGQLGTDIEGYEGKLMGQANASAGVLQGQAEELKGLGQQGMDEWRALSERGRTDLQKGLGQAATAAQGGVDFAQKALTGFKDMTAADISSNIWGMQRSFETQAKQLETGLGPDGNVMTAGEIQQARAALRQDFEGSRQQVITGIQSRQNEMIASLTNNISQAKFSQAGILQGNAQTLGAYDTNAGNQMVDLSRQRLQANERASQLYEVGEGYKQAAQMASIQARLNGQAMYADILQRFPYNPTSQFDALLMLANVTDLQKRQGVHPMDASFQMS